MAGHTSLVMGANGFLGSHITRQLTKQKQAVKAFVRASSDTRSIDQLNIPRCTGDIMDKGSLRDAMQGCDIIYYCIVDTRAWLKDTSPLYRTNIDGLRNVLEVAVELNIKKFVFTSSIVTIGLNPKGVVDETDAFNWEDTAPDYVRCRVQAEDMLFDYCRQYNLPCVALCVANTYGPGDIQPTPHGELIKNIAWQKTSLPIDCYNPVVDIRDAATAMILAADKGQSGERYIIVAEHAHQIEIFNYGADAAGVPHPKLKLSIRMVHNIAFVSEMVMKLFGKRTSLNRESVLIAHIFNKMDNSKAKTQLGWQPRPIKESIDDAVAFYLKNP
mgnify:CR=1 FL=1